MQTNKEFLDALDIRPDDGFLAVAVRRVAAWQLGKPVVELETDTQNLPDFILPWAPKEFAWQLEKELDIKIPVDDDEYRNKLISIPQDWFRGPVIKMPMGEWTKIAVEQFLGPIRDEIRCPENWTMLEPEGPPQKEPKTTFLFRWFGLYIPLTALALSIPGLFSSAWFQNVSIWCGGVIFCCWILPFLVLFAWAILFGKRRTEKNHSEKVDFKPAPPPQLLGTLTFQSNRLLFSDNDAPQDEIEITPGDYRLFLFRDDERSEFAPATIVLTTEPEPPPFIDFEDDSSVRQFIFSNDSCLIGISEQNVPNAAWQPGPAREVVMEVLQKSDKTVCGVKIVPRYGEGDNRIFVWKTDSSCSIRINLDVPDDDEMQDAIESIPKQAKPESQDKTDEFVPGPPPEKRRFQFEQSEDRFVFRHHMQRNLGIILLVLAVAMFLLPGFLAAAFMDGESLSLMAYSPIWLLAPLLLYLTFCRTEYRLDENGLVRHVITPFFTFEKWVPLHEIQKIAFYVDPQKSKSVRVKTDCEEFSIFDSIYISVSEEECRWLAGTIQALFLELKQKVKIETKNGISAPSKTRWKIRREFDRIEIVRQPPAAWLPLFFFTFAAFLTTLVMTVFWLVFLGIIPDTGPEHKRLTWKVLVILIPGTFAWGAAIACFFSVWWESLTWIRWTFMENEIVKRSSWFLTPKRFEIHSPSHIVMRNSTSDKPLYRTSFDAPDGSSWPNANSFGDQELVIHDDTTDRTVILGDMTFAEAVWLRDVLVREKLVHW